MISISVIIPIYNVERYVEKCLQSVVLQIYTGNIECILVDDCGTDGSMDLVRKFVDSYSGPIQFRILHHEKNCGLSAARNSGIREAKGEWLYFLDSDDYITPDSIELLVNKSKEYPRAQIIQGGAITDKGYPVHVDMESNSPRVVDYMDNPMTIKKGILLNNTCYACNAWNKLIKKEFLINNNLYFKEDIIYEDGHWQFFVVKHLYAVAFVRKNTYIYMVREDSIMRGYRWNQDEKSLNSWYIIANDFLNNLDDFCFEEQANRILEIALPIYRSTDNVKYRDLFRKQIVELKDNHLQGMYKAKVSFYLHIPLFILRHQSIFNFLLKIVKFHK